MLSMLLPLPLDKWMPVHLHCVVMCMWLFAVSFHPIPLCWALFLCLSGLYSYSFLCSTPLDITQSFIISVVCDLILFVGLYLFLLRSPPAPKQAQRRIVEKNIDLVWDSKTPHIAFRTMQMWEISNERKCFSIDGKLLHRFVCNHFNFDVFHFPNNISSQTWLHRMPDIV